MNEEQAMRIDDRLSRGWKKNLKFLHVFVAGISLGSLVSVLALLLPGSRQDGLVAASHVLIESVFVWSLSLSIVTGFLFSFFAGRGVVKSTWIICKWIGSFLVLAIYMFFVSPFAAGIAARWNVFHVLAYTDESVMSTLLLATSAVSLIYLFLFYISFKKPWGHRSTDPLTESPRVRLVLFILSALLGGYTIVMIFYFHSLRSEILPTLRWPESPGEYQGTIECAAARYDVRFVVNQDGVRNIQISSSRTSIYFEYAKLLKERLEKAEAFPVDAVTGATTTSVCILKSVAKAIRSAR